jgi:hypothetical protein
MIIFLGWPPRFSGTALAIYSSGYPPGIFRQAAVIEVDMRVIGSKTTFSRMVPKRLVQAYI